ncbi:MAG: hypothetical protein JWN48_2810 [Myxococcaceae bacterium]|nr:hypothetical protein [Myxococcaceae bacterium]
MECDSREHSLGRDDKHGAPDIDEDDDGESHAADEPTAVWDENALRAAGLGDLWRKREPEAPAPAATPTQPRSHADPSIVIEDLGLQPAPAVPEVEPLPVMTKAALQPATARGGLGWGSTLGLALALGALAYALIRFFKG